MLKIKTNKDNDYFALMHAGYQCYVIQQDSFKLNLYTFLINDESYCTLFPCEV